MTDLSSPWKFFKEIIVLNLSHREDRRTHIRNHLKRFSGLEYTFFHGVYGMDSKYLIDYVVNRKIVSPECNMSKAQIACAISHYLIWEQCLLRVPKNSEGYWVLILEDDVKFHPDFTNERLEEYLQQLPNDAKYFKFGYQQSDEYSLVTPVNAYWNKLEKQVFSTIAYAIHTDFLMSFLMVKFNQPLDWYPIKNAYGMRDIFESGNINQDFFQYYYYYPKNNVIYQYKGFYSGVASSFNDDTDSDINDFTTKYHDRSLEPPKA